MAASGGKVAVFFRKVLEFSARFGGADTFVLMAGGCGWWEFVQDRWYHGMLVFLRKFCEGFEIGNMKRSHHD
jgi:hypothetical protein